MNLSLKEVNIRIRYVIIFLLIILGYISINYYGKYEVLVSFGAIAMLYLTEFLGLFKIKITESMKFTWIVIMLFAIIGETIAVHYFWYDKLLHIFWGMWFYLLGIILLILRYGEFYVKKNYSKVFIYCFFFMLIALCAWEIFEATIDYEFGTNLLQTGIEDTLVDLISDSFGAVVGGLLCYVHFRKKPIYIFDKVLLEFKHKKKKKRKTLNQV